MAAMEQTVLPIAQRVIEKCGGHRVVAEMVGVDVCNVFRWTYPKDRGGTGGLIPARHQPLLLERARERRVPLTPADFFPNAAE